MNTNPDNPAKDRPTDELGKWEIQVRKGGLGLAVLATLWPEQLYGLEILRRLDSQAGLSIPEGTIYPMLNRMKTEGLVDSEWVEAAAGHPRKYYRLAEDGEALQRAMVQAWVDFRTAMTVAVEQAR